MDLDLRTLEEVADMVGAVVALAVDVVDMPRTLDQMLSQLEAVVVHQATDIRA